jgi:ankyrin repeat protein/predicted DNA-binding WGR domain protein
LLSKGCAINHRDDRGRTPLHYAFIKAHKPFCTTEIDPIETVANLLSQPGIEIDVSDNFGNTPLTYAAQRGSIISGLALLKAKAKIDHRNKLGNTPLGVALLAGHQNMAIFMIQKEADVKDLVSMTNFSVLAKELAEKLAREAELNKTPDQPEKNPNRFNAMLAAPRVRALHLQENEKEVPLNTVQKYFKKSNQDDVMVEEEEESLVDVNPILLPSEKTDHFGRRLAFKQHSRKKAATLKRRFNVFGGFQQQQEEEETVEDSSGPFREGESKATMFAISIRRNWQSVAYLLLQYNFDAGHAMLDSFENHNYNYVHTLLSRNTDAALYTQVNQKGLTLTHLFAIHAHRMDQILYEKIKRKLQERNVNFNIKDTNNRSALHYAAETGCARLFEWLLTYQNSNINDQDLSNMNPIQIALINGHETLIWSAYLKANVDSTVNHNETFKYEEENHTMVSWVSKYNCDQTKAKADRFNFLIQMGCDINSVDYNGWGCLVYAIRENDQKLFNFLAERPGIDLGIMDNNGKCLAHHVVNPRVVGSYENVELLNELHKLGVDLTVKDKNKSTPYDYASQQDSGVMAARLEELKADNRQLFDLKRAPTNILGDVNFPPVVHDFETDYEEFNTNCEEEAKKRRINITAEPLVEPKISGTVELCWEDADKQNAWDCLMVKCEVSRGYWSCNVFYKMQVVRDKVRGVFVLFTRWGRVNTEGQWQQTPFGTYEEATKEFSKIFKSKSGNDWATRANFEKVPGKYRLIQWTKKLKHTNQVKNFDLDQCKVSALSKTAMRFLYRVTSPSGFLSAYANFRVDDSLFPLQNLTKETLIDAENILKNIGALIDEKEKMFAKKDKDLKAIADKFDELSGLSSQFFELVPFRDDQGTTIDPIMRGPMLT